MEPTTEETEMNALALRCGDRFDYMGLRTVILVEQLAHREIEVTTVNDLGFTQRCGFCIGDTVTLV